MTDTSVKLSWDSGNSDPIDRYIIQYKDKLYDEDYEEIPNVYQTEYNILGLRPYTVYEFRVQSINNIGVSWPSNAKDVTTGERGTSTLCCCKCLCAVVQERVTLLNTQFA